MPTEPRIHRAVVSFVRRSTRMNPSQQRAWRELRGRFVVEVPRGEASTSVAADAHVAWDEVFGRSAPLGVEIGTGTGEALVALAEAHPELDIVGFEVYLPAVASTLARIERHRVSNVRVVVADGVAALATLFDAGALERLWTFFPDPWHKARHHKRRLVSPAFTDLVASRLAPTGTWHLATDWEDYALAMSETLDGCPGLVNVHDGWAPRPDERPVTTFERRGLAAGRAIRDLAYRRS